MSAPALQRPTGMPVRTARRKGTRTARKVPVLTMVDTPRGLSARRRVARELGEARRAAIAGHAARTRVEDDVEDGLDLLPPGQVNGRRGAPLRGPVGARVPWHVTSTARIGVLTPFAAPQTTQVPGPVLGIDAVSGAPFTFDPWGAYRAGLVTSPAMCWVGVMGSGKSMGAKTAAVRMVAEGRQVIVTSDPKGEWVAVARWLGGKVLAVGPGTRTVINLLDAGVRPAHVDASEWEAMVAARRATALTSICQAVRPEQGLSPGEQVVIDMVCERISSGQVPARLRDVVEYLRRRPPELIDQVGEEAHRQVRLMLGRLTDGPLAGAFDTDSTVELDPDAPMIVLDTSALEHAAPQVRQITTAATSAWIDATLRSGDGRFRVLIAEEAWSELRNVSQVTAMDERIRMAGHWRCSQWLIFHELTDIEQFGDADSYHRNRVKGILSKTAIKVLYRQSEKSLALAPELLNPTDAAVSVLDQLPQGIGVWLVGDATPIQVLPVMSPAAYAVFNTDAGRS